MRTILKYASSNDASGADVGAAIETSLAEFGWIRPDLGIDTYPDVDAMLVELASSVIDSARRAGRDLPASPDSQFIQNVIDRKFRPRSAPRSKEKKEAAQTGGDPEPFSPFSFERGCLEHAILILTQIDPNDRREAFGREMTVVVGPDYEVYGIMFRAPLGQNGDPSNGSYQTRLRSNDLGALQTATVSFVSALNPTKREGRIRLFSSRGAAVGRRGAARKPFRTDVQSLEIRSVANEKLFTGKVIPVTGRFSLLRHVLSGRSARALTILSVVLAVVSAALFAVAPNEGWWVWTEQLVGRLATGAFGALLVDGAIDYTALLTSLMAGSGPVTHGALIDWKRA